MKTYPLLLLVLLLAGAVSAQNGVIFESVVLEDGATDGSEGYYKIGNDIVISVMPGSYEEKLLAPLKGKRVRFSIVPAE